MIERAYLSALMFAVACWPGVAAAQVVAPVPPAEFATAASACIDAVSPDRLDTAKLVARGWVKQSDEHAPFGDTAIYAHSGNASRIYASPTPSGYCIVDGYGKDFSQFESYQGVIADRLKADFSTPGVSSVTIGKPGSDDRRQGFVVGNAVAGYSAAMRTGGLNLRFTTVNAKFAGSPQAFQTSRPPLSDAEIAENRAKELAASDFAKGPGTVQDLTAMVKDCSAALRGDGSLPGQGWRKSTHMSGSPRSVEAMKKGDMKSMLAGMAQTRQIMFMMGRRGLVTKYYVRGMTNACAATIFVDAAAIDTIKTDTMRALALGTDKGPSSKVNDFASEYMIESLNRTYQWEQSEIGFQKGVNTNTDGPEAGKSYLSIFVF